MSPGAERETDGDLIGKGMCGESNERELYEASSESPQKVD